MTNLQAEGPRNRDFIDEWMKEYFDVPVSLGTKRLGFGRSPAVLVTDLQKDIELEGLVSRAVKNIAVLLSKARERDTPIIYTVIGYRQDLKDFLPTKLSSMSRHTLGTRNVEVLDEVKPAAKDIVLIKKANSAFLGTELLIHLVLSHIDTLILTGCHTSGCIRATATDCFSLGFKCVIPEECVGDSKGLNPHRANLCDLHIRGADVITLEEVLRYLDEVAPRRS